VLHKEVAKKIKKLLCRQFFIRKILHASEFKFKWKRQKIFAGALASERTIKKSRYIYCITGFPFYFKFVLWNPSELSRPA
jgi:hypothetical protein